MRPPGEIPMKALMTKRFLATRSHASTPCVSIRERAGTRLTSMPVMPGGTGRRHRGQTFFRFTYFHGPLAAHPLGWPLRNTNAKVREHCEHLCGRLLIHRRFPTSVGTGNISGSIGQNGDISELSEVKVPEPKLKTETRWPLISSGRTFPPAGPGRNHRRPHGRGLHRSAWWSTYRPIFFPTCTPTVSEVRQ
jgi:hypothetical protein